MADFEAVGTDAGVFRLAMRAGLAIGSVLGTIVGDPAVRLEYVVAGRAIDRAAAAEQRAAIGQVVVDGGLLEADSGIDAVELRDDAHLVRRIERPVETVPASPAGRGRRRRHLPPGSLPPSGHRRAPPHGTARPGQRASQGDGGLRRLPRPAGGGSGSGHQPAGLPDRRGPGHRPLRGPPQPGRHRRQGQPADAPVRHARGARGRRGAGGPLLPGAAPASRWTVPGGGHHRVRLLRRDRVRAAPLLHGGRRLGEPCRAAAPGGAAGTAADRRPDLRAGRGEAPSANASGRSRSRARPDR